MFKKRTKIVATVGPASESKTKLQQLVKAGVNVFRLNFSHGDFAEHGRRIKRIRELEKKLAVKTAILQDLGGVKLRIGDFKDGEIVLKKGQNFILTTKKIVGDDKRVYINYKKLPKEVAVGQKILLDDGTKELRVVKIDGDEVLTKVVAGGLIRSRRGVNIPNARLSASALTKKDKKDLRFGLEQGVDFVAISFVRYPRDIKQLRNVLKRYKSPAQIVAKIETPEAVENIDEIISLTDVIMIARGDLAVEIPPQEVPHLQKMIIKKCRTAGKPVIVATQMMESMIKNPTPTRAEITDVSNAILDGTDAIMLSAETAMGKFPVETVRIMSKIAIRTEQEILYKNVLTGEKCKRQRINALTRSVVQTALDIDAKYIVVLTESGLTARKISEFRPRQIILALTPNVVTARQLNISYGCYPYNVDSFDTVENVIKKVKNFLKKNRLAKKGEKIVITAGIPFGKEGTANMMIIQEL